MKVWSHLCVCVCEETERRVEIREERVLCVHCSVTKWEWNGTAGLKKREDWISAKHGPLGQRGRASERQTEGWRQRRREGDDDAGTGKSEKRAVKLGRENWRETGKWVWQRWQGLGGQVKGKDGWREWGQVVSELWGNEQGRERVKQRELIERFYSSKTQGLYLLRYWTHCQFGLYFLNSIKTFNVFIRLHCNKSKRDSKGWLFSLCQKLLKNETLLKLDSKQRTLFHNSSSRFDDF